MIDTMTFAGKKLYIRKSDAVGRNRICEHCGSSRVDYRVLTHDIKCRICRKTTTIHRV